MRLKLVWIGDGYYGKSGTIMSPLYDEGTWKRSDWGFVNAALRNGNSVVIRQATASEREAADRMLSAIIAAR